MTQAFNGGDNSRFSVSSAPSKLWQNIAIGSLGFWLSGSLMLDFVVMPTMWATGMMESSGFASASYSIFWIFNRVELVCAAAALSTIWALSQVNLASVERLAVCVDAHNPEGYTSESMRRCDSNRNHKMFAGAVMLMAIALSYTFILTPYMSGLGFDADIFTTTQSLPAEMDRMHSIYWVLEASKLAIVGMLLFLVDRFTSEHG